MSDPNPLLTQMFGGISGTPYSHTFTSGAAMARPDWLTDEDSQAIAAFIDEHGHPVAWEIEGGAGEYLSTHCRFADGAVLSFTTGTEENQ